MESGCLLTWQQRGGGGGGRSEEHTQLTAALEATGVTQQEGSRQLFLRRLMDLTRNRKKQEIGIADISTDTRALQRESNAAQERLKRSFTVVDHLIFR